VRARRLHKTLLALGCLAALACSSPEERFAEHVERAQGYVAENRTDDALIELQSALKIDPDDADVNEQLAGLLKQRGSIQAAAFHYGETYRLDPTRVGAAVEQAILLWQTAPRRSRQILAEAHARFPDEPLVYRGEATLAASQKDTDAAVTAAKRAVELGPDDPENWAALGAVYLQRTRDLRDQGGAPESDYMAGIAAFEKLDALTEGGHVVARVERARLLANLPGHEDEAVAGFRSAIELGRSRNDPASVVFAARRFAGYARRAGKHELQREALRAIVDADPERVRDWETLASVEQALNGLDAAEAIYAELLEEQGQLPQAHLAYSRFLLRTRRPGEAIAHLDQAISEGNDAPELWEQLVRLELAQNRVADARATIEDMRSRLGDHDATRRSEVRLALRERRAEDALEILREFAGSKESVETEILRAQAERLRGDLAAAASAAERALVLSRGRDVTALRLKADIHGEAGEWQAALTTLEQLSKRTRGLTNRERVLEARAHYELGDADQGRAVLSEVLAGSTPPPDAAVEFAKREGAEHPAEARKHLEKALRLVPGYFPALEVITRMDLKDDHAPRALARLDGLVEQQLAGPRVLLLRSQVLTRLGQLDRAEADALRAFEAIPELTEAVDMLFVIYQAQGKLDEARRSFEEAESVGVLHKGARVLLGRLYATAGEEDKAQEMYEKVLAEDPEMVSAKLDLARLLAERDDELDRALELAEDAQRALPDDPAVADVVGTIYQRKGQHEVALQQFRYALGLADAMDIAPPALHYHMGVSLAALGRKPEAAAAFDRALAIDPKFSDAREARTKLGAVQPPAEAKSAS
jgi:tetratricopeptide (TPR) repeat protein